MKKLFVLLVFIGLLTSCEKPNVVKDPTIKESERIAVIQKAKTDTTRIYIEMDDYAYVIEDQAVIARTKLNTDDSTALLLFFCVIVLSVAHLIRD